MAKNASKPKNKNKPSTVDKLPADKRSIDQTRFRYRTVTGRIIDVPSAGFTPFPLMMALNRVAAIEDEDERLERTVALLQELPDTPEARKAFDTLGLVEMERFLRLWTKSGGARSPK